LERQLLWWWCWVDSWCPPKKLHFKPSTSLQYKIATQEL
jgi:hypothetical protein